MLKIGGSNQEALQSLGLRASEELSIEAVAADQMGLAVLSNAPTPTKLRPKLSFLIASPNKITRTS